MNLLIFDSGLGGLSVTKAIVTAYPSANITYLADHAGFPYGQWSENELIERVLNVLDRELNKKQYDCVIIACNTASTICLPALRQAFKVPFIGTVPAIKPAAQLTKSGMISVLATQGTIKREYTKSLIDNFAKKCEVTLVPSKHLAQIAEDYLMGKPVDNALLQQEIAPCFVAKNNKQTDQIVLACTHYPLILPLIKAVAPFEVNYIDPAPAIARRILEVIPFKEGQGRRNAFTTGDKLQELLTVFNAILESK